MYLWKDSRLRLRITLLGIQYVTVTGAVGLLGMYTNNNLLHAIFGMMIGLLLVSGWVSRAALLGIEPEMVMEGTFFAKTKGGLRLRLKNQLLKRVRGLEISLIIPECEAKGAFYHGGKKQKTSNPIVAFGIRPEKRGEAKIARVDFRTTFPFGFLEKTYSFHLDLSFFVAPHPVGFENPIGGDGEFLEPSPASGFSSPEGAKPFAIGDSISKIHWKRTAQRGEPWVRQMEGDRPKGIELELNLTDWVPGEDFEQELEKLSGSILQAWLSKTGVTLNIYGSPDGAEWVNVAGAIGAWKALATVQARPRA